MANPEFPILATGGIVLLGGWRREKKWPKNGTRSVAALVVLVVIGSALGKTPVGPVISALAWLILLGAVYATIPAFKV
jgi:hypothetical protein